MHALQNFVCVLFRLAEAWLSCPIRFKSIHRRGFLEVEATPQIRECKSWLEIIELFCESKHYLRALETAKRIDSLQDFKWTNLPFLTLMFHNIADDLHFFLQTDDELFPKSKC